MEDSLMAGYRFWSTCSAALLATLLIVQVGSAQEKCSCKVYSLADIGDDGKLGKWVAETIPEMIQPATWKQADAKLSYFAPSKILVVNNTPAVHAQVEEFLNSLRKATSQPKRHDGQIVPAQFLPQEATPPASGVQSGPTGYPVPTSPVGPKHLFHFIIRYEGEGIIDSNVSKFAKSLIEANKENSSGQANFSYPPMASPVASAPTTVRGSSEPLNAPVVPAKLPAPQMPPADGPTSNPIPTQPSAPLYVPVPLSTVPVPPRIPTPPPPVVTPPSSNTL
jgi:hypothetical protein